MLVLASLPLLLVPQAWPVTAGLVLLLVLAQAPLTGRLVRRTRQARFLTFAVMSFVRAFWRGIGMTMGVLAFAYHKLCGRTERRPMSE